MKLRTFPSFRRGCRRQPWPSPPLPPWRKPRTERIPHVAGAGHRLPLGQGRRAVQAEQSRERTDGRINIKLYPGVSLIQGDQTREFSALRQGVIDMAVGSTAHQLVAQVKQLNLFSLPFLFPDYAAVVPVTQGDVGKQIFATLDKAGVVPLAWGENGYREISNSKQAIKSPAESRA